MIRPSETSSRNTDARVECSTYERTDGQILVPLMSTRFDSRARAMIYMQQQLRAIMMCDRLPTQARYIDRSLIMPVGCV